MIKITDPSQSPAALFYAFRDQEERGPGNCPWRRGGCRRFGVNHPGATAAAPAASTGTASAPAATHGGCPARASAAPAQNNEEFPRWKARWDRRQDRCGRRLNEAVAPFVAAFDKMVQNPSSVVSEGPTDVAKAFSDAVQGISGAVAAVLGADEETANEAAAASAASNSDAQEALEEQLMQEALQESILLHEVSTAFADVETGIKIAESSSTSSAAAVAVSAPAVAAPVAAPAPSSLPKPALRFISDVSFADGAAVVPGSSFKKLWRVRNDGQYAWPADVVLVPAGGDVMCPEDTKIALPILAVGEERDIGIDLEAPRKAGLYTAYFRAQTKEKQYFGHRLWATVLVSEPTPVVAAKPAPSADVTVETVEDEWTNVDARGSPVSATPFASGITTTSAVPVAAAAGPVVSPVPAASTPAPVATPPAPQPLHLLWRKELAILADMGFVDADVNVPLLRRYLNDTPVILRGDRDAVPDSQGMQRVIAELLGM